MNARPYRDYESCRLYDDCRFEAALLQLPADKALARSRHDDVHYFDLIEGACLLELLRFDDATALFFRLWTQRSAIRSFNPNKIRFNLALALQGAGHPDKARIHVEAFLEHLTDEDDVIHSSAYHLLSLIWKPIDPRKALELLQTGLEILGPEAAAPMQQIEEVECAVESGAYELALELAGRIERSRLTTMQKHQVQCRVITALARSNRWEELVETFEQGLKPGDAEEAPFFVDLYALAGMAYRMVGRLPDAERAIQTAWRLYQRTGQIQNARLLEEMHGVHERVDLDDLPYDQLMDNGMIGLSPPMQRLKKQIAEIRDGRLPVLISGESGTGKELTARALATEGQPFVPVNCRAVPPQLFSALLFGHARGSFTGAHAEAKGWVQEADGGVLFLDEVADLPFDIQPLLFRFLDDGSYYRVGESIERSARVRIVAATNLDMLDRDQVRPELTNRLSGFRIDLPPLRDRGDDLLYLANWFVRQYNVDSGKKCRLGPSPQAVLRSWHWPGNVRELRFLIHRACTLSPHEFILPALSKEIERQRTESQPDSPPPAGGTSFQVPVERLATDPAVAGRRAADAIHLGDGFQLQGARRAFESTLRERALDACGGNIRAAARLLGESPIGIQRLLKQRNSDKDLPPS